MNIPISFIETFGLVIDPLYPELEKVANHFTRGETYTMKQIFAKLEEIYRKPNLSNEDWYYKVNKTVDALIHYDLIEYNEGYYLRTKN